MKIDGHSRYFIKQLIVSFSLSVFDKIAPKTSLLYEENKITLLIEVIMVKTKKATEQEFEIPIEELFPKFESHLKIKNNTRILFSGKFGIGYK